MTHSSDAIADAHARDLYRYAAVFKSNTNIADAMAYTSLHADIKAAIWDACEAAESLGYVAALPRPASLPADTLTWLYQGTWNASTNTPTLASGVGTENHVYTVGTAGSTTLDGFTSWTVGEILTFREGQWWDGTALSFITMTRSEAIAQYAAKVAHALTIEIDREFPWSLCEYTAQECACIFDPEIIFYSWDPEGATPAQWYFAVDHSPRDAYLTAQSLLSSPATPRAAVIDLLDYHRANVVHSTSAVDHPMVALTIPDFYDERNEFNAYLRAHFGCNHMGSQIVALATSVNLPAYRFTGKFAGSGHWSAAFYRWRARKPPTIASTYGYLDGGVLGHNDNIYTGTIDPVPTGLMLEPMGYWDDYIFSTEDGPTESLHTNRMFRALSASYGLSALVTSYKTSGWTYIRDTLLEPYLFLPTEQYVLDYAEADLAARSGLGQI